MEAGVPAFQLPMFVKVTRCRKEICSTCLSNESMPFDPFVKSKPPLPTRSLSSRERQYVRQLCIMVASVASCLQKIELWYPRFGLIIDCDLGCLINATAASQWRIVEIQLLASVVWQWGCRPFSCRCSSKWLTVEKRFVPHVCPRNPCLLILLWNLSLHSLPEAWVPESIMLAKDRVVWVVVSKIWIDCDLGCLINATAASQWRIVEIQLLASVGWQWGCRVAGLSAAHVRKIWGHVCLRNPFLPFLLGIQSIQSLLEVWGSWERQYAPPALRYEYVLPALCIMAASVASCLQKIELWYPRFGLIVILVVLYMRLLQVNEELSRFSF